MAKFCMRTRTNRVQDTCWVLCYEINDIFSMCVHTFAAVTSGRSLEHRQVVLYQPVGWLAAAVQGLCISMNSTGVAAAAAGPQQLV